MENYSFGLDEHNCLTIETADNRILLYLQPKELDNLYDLLQDRTWEDF